MGGNRVGVFQASEKLKKNGINISQRQLRIIIGKPNAEIKAWKVGKYWEMEEASLDNYIKKIIDNPDSEKIIKYDIRVKTLIKWVKNGQLVYGETDCRRERYNYWKSRFIEDILYLDGRENINPIVIVRENKVRKVTLKGGDIVRILVDFCNGKFKISEPYKDVHKRKPAEFFFRKLTQAQQEQLLSIKICVKRYNSWDKEAICLENKECDPGIYNLSAFLKDIWRSDVKGGI